MLLVHEYIPSFVENWELRPENWNGMRSSYREDSWGVWSGKQMGREGIFIKKAIYTFICSLFVTRPSLSVVGFGLRMGREERGSHVLSPWPKWWRWRVCSREPERGEGDESTAFPMPVDEKKFGNALRTLASVRAILLFSLFNINASPLGFKLLSLKNLPWYGFSMVLFVQLVGKKLTALLGTARRISRKVFPSALWGGTENHGY